MRAFQHLAPPLRLYHGDDSLSFLPRELERLGVGRVAVFCGSTLAKAGSALDRVVAAVGAHYAGVFSGVKSHSPLPAVEAGAAMLRQSKADAIIAVGGGSAIVTARAAAILLGENRPAHALCTDRGPDGVLQSPKLQAPKLPQFIVPTLPTTAMVKAGSAVYDPATGRRLALFDPKTRVHALFLDPVLLASSPDQFLVSAGLNTLTAACEGLMSRTGDPIADAHILQALRLLADNLPDASRHHEDEVRSALMLSAVLCGRGTDHTGAGVATALGHAIAGRHHVENGIANSILLPHAVRFNAVEGQSGVSKIAGALGLDIAGGDCSQQVADALERIGARLAVPRRLRDCGVPRDALGSLAEAALGDWLIRGNPRRVGSASELQEMLELAW